MPTSPPRSSQQSLSLTPTGQSTESSNPSLPRSPSVVEVHGGVAGASPVGNVEEIQPQMDEQGSQSTVSPVIKRRRTSGSVISSKQEATCGPKIEVDEDEINCCPICLEPWTNTGSHQACCMPCGHIFGYQCIKDWLKCGTRGGKRPCPTCKSPGRVKDLRYLFGLPTRFSAADTSLSESLKRQLEEERKAHNLTKEKLHEKQKLVFTLRQSLKEVARRFPSSRGGVASFGESRKPEHKIKMFASHPTNGETQTATFDTEARLLFPERSTHGGVTQFRIKRLNLGGSSVASSSPLVFAKRVSSLDVCSKPESNYRGYIATTVATKKVHILAPDLQSATQFPTPTQPTSCFWLSSMPHILAVGHMTGEVCTFDVRFLNNGPVSQANICDRGWRLVHSLGEMQVEHQGSKDDVLVTAAPKGVFVSKLHGSSLNFQTLISKSHERVCGMSLTEKLIAVTSQNEESAGCVTVYDGMRKRADMFELENTLGVPESGLSFDCPFVQAGLIDGDTDYRNTVMVCPDSTSNSGFKCWGHTLGRTRRSQWQAMSIIDEGQREAGIIRGVVGFSFSRSARMDCIPRNARSMFACFSDERIRIYFAG